jgi:hypothetical protein
MRQPATKLGLPWRRERGGSSKTQSDLTFDTARPHSHKSSLNNNMPNKAIVEEHMLVRETGGRTDA